MSQTRFPVHAKQCAFKNHWAAVDADSPVKNIVMKSMPSQLIPHCAEYDIGIEASIKTDIAKLLTQNLNLCDLLHLFDPACIEIYALLKKSFKRFKFSLVFFILDSVSFLFCLYFETPDASSKKTRMSSGLASISFEIVSC